VLPKLWELITALGYPGTTFGFNRPGPAWPAIEAADAALFALADGATEGVLVTCRVETLICRVNSRRDPSRLIVTTL
jgi:hypothetical protein